MRNKKVCLICNKEFEPQRSTAMFCGADCKKQAAKIRNANRRGAEIIKDCPVCGKRFETGKNGALTKYCSQNCADEARRVRNRDRWRKQNPGWDEGTNKVCEYCGNKFIDESKSKHARFCSDECGQTWYSREVRGHGPREEYIEERKKQAEERQAEVERERALRTLRTTLVKIIKLKEEEGRIKELTRGCVECGEMFYNPSPNVLTCSTECSRKRNRRISRTIYKGRINDSNLVDKNITLTKLYKRTKGTCYLCGEQCDWDDKVVTDEGHTIVGESYPSIEHVIPLSKGGKHSWNNVKLACMKCNILKRDKIINVKDKRAIV